MPMTPEEVRARLAVQSADECFFEDCPDPPGTQPLRLHDGDETLEVPLCAAHWLQCHRWMHYNAEEHSHADEEAS